jgi:transcriptional regulator with XRE-family HTH domain
MTDQDREFFQAFGERIASLRQRRGLTQIQLAEQLGYSQQQVLSFEKGRRRMYISALPKLSEALGVSLEELLGEEQTESRGRPTKLQTQFKRLATLPKSRQETVSKMLEGLLKEG